MVASCSIIKKTARAALQGKYLRCAIAAAIPIFMTFGCMLASELFLFARPMQAAYFIVFAILFVCLLLPLYFGTLRFFWRAFSNCEDDPITVFHYFSKGSLYKKAMKLVCRFVFRAVGYGLLFFLPAIVTGILADSKIYDLFGMNMPDFSSVFWILSGFLGIIATIALLCVMLKCYIAPFLLVADEEMEPDEAMHMSFIISKGTVVDYVVLVICFAHWILLSLLAIPLLFTVPYMIMAYLVHARFATARYNQMISRKKEENNTPTFVAGM